MELLLRRIARQRDYTIGKLYIDGEYVCDTLEDTDRGLTCDMSEAEIAAVKVAGRTAIPTGEYEVTLSVVSPKFSKKSAYAFCGGKLPRLVGVRGFDGVLLHSGNTSADTAGCILVGRNTRVGALTNSLDTLRTLYARLVEPLTIKVE